MTTRYRMTIAADRTGGNITLAPQPAPAAAPPPPVGTQPAIDTGRFHTLIIVEGVMTGDKRIFSEGGLEWRDLPLPLMAHDETMPEHIGSVLIGNIDTITRQGNEVHGWGSYLSAPDAEAAQLIAQVRAGELRGISADIDNVEYEVLVPQTDANGDPLPDPMMGLFDLFMDDETALADAPPPPPTEVLPDGIEYEVIPIPQEVLRVTIGRIMGCTVEPFPAFQEAFIEDDTGTAPAIAASGARQRYGRSMRRAMCRAHKTGVMLQPSYQPAVTAAADATGARFEFPTIPPREWFDVGEADGPTALTITDGGQVYGHLAVWGECHIGLAGECVEPPPSPSNYARYHMGEIPVDDGTRVSVGHLTFATGHADLNLGPEATRAHYDNTGTVWADVQAHDGEYGIWVCGAARPGLTTGQIREIMSAPPSGDWRRFGRELDMVAALGVNVPGFGVQRARVRKELGLVASLIVCNPVHPVVVAAGYDPALNRRVIDRIAAQIGRSKQDRIAALAARVHGGK